MADKNNDQHHGNEPAETAANTVGTRAPSIPNNPSEDDHPPSGQQTQELAEMNILPSDDAQEHDSDTDVDPAEQIDDFDWDFLHERYHDAMSSASAQELALMQEFAQLMDYFKIWADAGANQESDRTFHRLRTRMTYVQNSEHKLERTREHYIQVVGAFESALALLRGSGFGA